MTTQYNLAWMRLGQRIKKITGAVENTLISCGWVIMLEKMVNSCFWRTVAMWSIFFWDTHAWRCLEVKNKTKQNWKKESKHQAQSKAGFWVRDCVQIPALSPHNCALSTPPWLSEPQFHICEDKANSAISLWDSSKSWWMTWAEEEVSGTHKFLTKQL